MFYVYVSLKHRFYHFMYNLFAIFLFYIFISPLLTQLSLGILFLHYNHHLFIIKSINKKKGKTPSDIISQLYKTKTKKTNKKKNRLQRNGSKNYQST